MRPSRDRLIGSACVWGSTAARGGGAGADEGPGLLQYAKDVADTIASRNVKVYLSSDVLLMSGLARAVSEKPAKKRGWFSFLGF